MKRKEFISKISLGAAFALTFGCMSGCTEDTPSIVIGDVDFEIDLSKSDNSDLLVAGGYIVINQVVVAKNDDNEYVAATQVCSHENKKRIILKNNQWFCPDHGAKFDLTGEGLNKDGKKGLTIFNTKLAGDILRVFS